MKVIFYLGKGGVGKSSLSILHALSKSLNGFKVALVSLDRAHNLFDILKAKPSELPEVLNVVEADIDRFSKQYLRDTENQLHKTYSYLTAINLEKHFKILRLAPGMEEFGLLLAFKYYYEKFKTYDYLIFDMPPTAIALKFFSLPSVSLIWLQQLLLLRSEILKKKEIISSVKFGKSIKETDKVLQNLNEQKKRYENLIALFSDASRCWINIVSTPDSIAISESKRIDAYLKELHIQVHAVFVNKFHAEVNINKNESLFLKKTVFFIPKSHHSLIGLDNLKTYLGENKILIEIFEK